MTTPGWQPLLDAIEVATDDRTRHALQLVAEHVVAEVEGDVERLLKTLVPEPTYRFWGAGGRPGFHGEQGVRAFYDHLIGTGKNRLDYVLDRVVADAATVVTDGVIHHVLDGADLVGRVSTEIEAGHWYHVTYRSLIVWPIDPASGLLTGEEVHLGEDHQVVREIYPEELPHLGLATRLP